MHDSADIPQDLLWESSQATPDVMSNRISAIDDNNESNDSQSLLDLQFTETFWCVFDIPVAPFRKHAADGKIYLGFSILQS